MTEDLIWMQHEIITIVSKYYVMAAEYEVNVSSQLFSILTSFFWKLSKSLGEAKEQLLIAH